MLETNPRSHHALTFIYLTVVVVMMLIQLTLGTALQNQLLTSLEKTC